MIKSLKNIEKSIVLFLILCLIWYIFIFQQYEIKHILPQVQIGKFHSWPLLFFLLDAYSVGLTIFYTIIVWLHLNSKKLLNYILLGLLLIYPILMISATYEDLYSSFCLRLDPVSHDCVEYRPSPDWGDVHVIRKGES